MKSILLSLVALATGISAMAQENDDMYFSSKDRAKINLKSREEVVLASAKENGTAQTINPSDSYSARNENPDYVAGAKVGANASASTSYFNSNYQPTINQSLYNNNCNCGYNNYNSYNSYAYRNPYYYNSYGFGSPYSSFYPYGYGYGMNSFGLSYGMGYYGMGGMYGMYGSPYMGYGYSPYGYGYYPYGYSYGYGYGYPSGVTYTTTGTAHDATGPVYGRHPSRSSSLSNYYTSAGRTANGTSAYYGNGRTTSGARTMASNQNTQYYNNAWKQSAANNRGNTWSSTNNRSSFWNNTGSSWNNSNSGGSRQSTFSNPSSGWGGGMRTSGFSGGGGGGFSGGGGGHVSGGGGGHGRR